MTKNIKNKLVCLIISIFTLGCVLSEIYAAASFSASLSKRSVTVGTSVTLTVKANNCAGKFSVYSSNTSVATVSTSSTFLDNNTTTIRVTTKKAGKATISVKALDVADYDENTVPGTKSIVLTVKEKASTNTPSGGSASGNTTANKKSSNANISRLTLGVEGLSFNKNQTTYNIKVGEDVKNISAGVTLESSKATYYITGNKNLKAGNNVIKIVVTAENGTTKTYKINVEKAGNFEETDATLTNLIIEDMEFNEPFNSLLTDYTGSKMNYTNKLNILPYTKAEKATYEIIGNENLKVGENTVIIKVTSKDGTNTKEYKIKFKMLSKNETDALVTVNPYVENNISGNNIKVTCLKIWELIKQNATIILLYLLALVEFFQVVYLYVQLKKVDPDKVTVRRRKKE